MWDIAFKPLLLSNFQENIKTLFLVCFFLQCKIYSWQVEPTILTAAFFLSFLFYKDNKEPDCFSVQGFTHCSWKFCLVLLSRWPPLLGMTHWSSDSEVASNKTRTVQSLERTWWPVEPVWAFAEPSYWQRASFSLMGVYRDPWYQFLWSAGSVGDTALFWKAPRLESILVPPLVWGLL